VSFYLRMGMRSIAIGHNALKTPRSKSRSLFAGVVFIALLVSAIASVGCTQQEIYETDTARGLNDLRAANGLPPLPVDATLSYVARLRAEDMARNAYFSHMPPDGCDYRCLFERHGVQTNSWIGEVIAWNNYPPKQSVATTVQMWRDSPGHFAVITNQCFTRMGAGVATAPDGKIYYAAVFEGISPACR